MAVNDEDGAAGDDGMSATDGPRSASPEEKTQIAETQAMFANKVHVSLDRAKLPCRRRT